MRRFRDDRARALFAGAGRACHRPAGRPRDERRRPDVRARRARARLAAAARRLPVDLRRPRRVPARPRRHGPHRTSRSSAWTTCRPPARTSSTPRPPPWPGSRASAGLRRIPVRRGRLQDRLRAGRPGALDREEPRRAGTVQIGAEQPGDRRRAARGLRAGAPPTTPFLITAQPSLVDPSRAPEGKHVFWAYGHVPNGWEGDLTDAVERQTRALRTRFPGPRPRPGHGRPARTRRAQRQLRRRRHRLRRRLGSPAAAAPQAVPVPVLHPAPGGLHLLLGHPAGPRACTACPGTTRRRPSGGASVRAREGSCRNGPGNGRTGRGPRFRGGPGRGHRRASGPDDRADTPRRRPRRLRRGARRRCRRARARGTSGGRPSP